MAGYSREVAKVAAALRAQRALQKSFDQIDWIHDVYNPTLERVKLGELSLEGTVDLLELTKGDDAAS